MAELAAIPRCGVSDTVRLPLLKGRKSDCIAAPSSGFTSLPPLPRHPCPKLERCRPWGEDAVLERCGFDVRFRNNYYCCHPIKDTSEEHEGFKFPKSMYTDLSVFHNPANSTTRHVPRNPTCEVFPTHNTQRTQDGRYVLTDKTRDTLAKGVQKLYRTSRYDDIFRDPTDQPRSDDECAEFVKAQSLHQCQPMDITKHGNVTCYGDPDATCNRSDELNHCIPEVVTLNSYRPDMPRKSRLLPSRVCFNTKETDGENPSHWQTFDGWFDLYDVHPDILDVHPDDFGPWTDSHRLEDAEKPYLVQDVYNYKFPSSLHCEITENSLASNFLERHNPENYHYIPVESSQYFLPWISMDRAKSQFAAATSRRKRDQVHEYAKAEMTLTNQRNSWTSRGEDNLRIPFISSVLGSLSKTAAHKRFHEEHPESIPDLRDFQRYSRRVNFLGYNTSMFR